LSLAHQSREQKCCKGVFTLKAAIWSPHRGANAMCDKCEEIGKTIERYRRIKERISDQQLIDAAQKLIDELEADKAALHPERSM